MAQRVVLEVTGDVRVVPFKSTLKCTLKWALKWYVCVAFQREMDAKHYVVCWEDCG